MFYMTAEELEAIVQRKVSRRTFVRMIGKNRDTSSPVEFCFWTDGGLFDAEVVDALTGSTVEKTFVGGALTKVGRIPLITGVKVRTVDLEFSGVDATVDSMLRTYDLRGGRVQIHRGWFNPDTLTLVSPARCRFVGFVDEAPVTNGREGEEAKVTVTCVSHTRELTRKNNAVRSHESQIARAPGDAFYKDVAVVSDWDIAWGEQRKKAGADAQFSPREGMFG